MRRTQLKLSILSMLSEHEECYGLEIIKAHDIKGGSLYPALEQLRQEGWVSVRYEKAPNRGPVRKFYRLTPKGQKEYERWS